MKHLVATTSLALAALALAPEVAHADALERGDEARFTLSPSLGISPGHLFTLGVKAGPTLLLDAKIWRWLSIGGYTSLEPQWWIAESERVGTLNLDAGYDVELRHLVGPGFTWQREDGERQTVYLLLGVEQRWVKNRVVNADVDLDATHAWGDAALIPAIVWSSYNPIREDFGWTFCVFAPLNGWPFDAPRRMSLDVGLAWRFR